MSWTNWHSEMAKKTNPGNITSRESNRNLAYVSFVNISYGEEKPHAYKATVYSWSSLLNYMMRDSQNILTIKEIEFIRGSKYFQRQVKSIIKASGKCSKNVKVRGLS